MSSWQAFFLGIIAAWTPTMVWLAVSLSKDVPEFTEGVGPPQ